MNIYNLIWFYLFLHISILMFICTSVTSPQSDFIYKKNLFVKFDRCQYSINSKWEYEAFLHNLICLPTMTKKKKTEEIIWLTFSCIIYTRNAICFLFKNYSVEMMKRTNNEKKKNSITNNIENQLIAIQMEKWEQQFDIYGIFFYICMK